MHLDFFTWKQFQAHGREEWYVGKSAISVNPLETDENTEAQSCPKRQAGAGISASDYVSVLTTVSLPWQPWFRKKLHIPFKNYKLI